MGRSTLIVMGCLYTLGCSRGSRAHASSGHETDAAPPAQTAAQPSPQDDANGGPPASHVACTPDPKFPGALELPEGSGAAEVELTPGVREMLVVADSGHHGAAVALPIGGGASRALTLPLDAKVSDDVEGIAWRAGHLYALTSTGMVERFTPDGHGGLRRDGDAYPIGPAPYVCKVMDPEENNCGMNYEGLCLRAGDTPDRCAGYVASKKEGWLGCVIFQGDRLVIDPIKPKLALGLPKRALSDCAFGAAGGPAAKTLLVTTNIFGGSTSYVVNEGTGALSPLDLTGTPTNEAIAVDHEGGLLQVMDDNGERSPVLRALCTGF